MQQSFRVDARRGASISVSTSASSELLSSSYSSAMTTPILMTPTLQPPQASDYLPSISPSVVYSTAHAVWTSQELQLLGRGLADFPVESYDNVTRYIKIAATIPGKCVRDVAFRVKAQTLDAEAGRELYTKRMRIDPVAELSNMASQQPLDDVQLSALFQDNVHSINLIRNNLLNGRANENKDVMAKFRDNCHTLMSAIGDICSTIPPLPVQMDTSLITGTNAHHS